MYLTFVYKLLKRKRFELCHNILVLSLILYIFHAAILYMQYGVILLVNSLFYTASYFLYVFFVGGSISSQSSQNDTPRVVLVFFLGGCTFAEVSALRFLSQQEDCKNNFISTHLLPTTPLLAELPAQPFFTPCAYFAA